MSFIEISLLAIAIIIITVLAAYAWHLTQRVKQAEALKQQEEANAELQLRQHQQELVNDIRFIAQSVVQQQCDITEGVLRVQHMLTGLAPDVWELEELSATRRHYQATQDMPILQAYKALTPKQQFELDAKRLTLENENRLTIEQEFRWLSTYTFPQVTLLQ